MEDLPKTDPFEIADLLVRCSCVPFSRISSVLGFEEPEQFSHWFEGRGGHHPEAARATYRPLRGSEGGQHRLLRGREGGRHRPLGGSEGGQNGSSLTGEAKQETASDGPDEALLLHVRRVFAAVLERPDTARIIRALRSRKPVRLEP